jgi:hypothetical protein
MINWKPGAAVPDHGDGNSQTLQFLVVSVLKVDGLPGIFSIIIIITRFS